MMDQILKWSNCIMPLIIILVLLIFMNRVQTDIEVNRNLYAGQYIDILEIILNQATPGESIDETSILIIEYINSIPGKVATIYRHDTELNRIVVLCDLFQDPFNFYEVHTNLGYLIYNYKYGSIHKYITGYQQDIYFRWVQLSSPYDRYLIIYSMNETIMSVYQLRSYMTIVIVIVLCFALKVIFIDNMRYIRVLQKYQRVIDTD